MGGQFRDELIWLLRTDPAVRAAVTEAVMTTVGERCRNQKGPGGATAADVEDQRSPDPDVPAGETAEREDDPFWQEGDDA